MRIPDAVSLHGSSVIVKSQHCINGVRYSYTVQQLGYIKHHNIQTLSAKEVQLPVDRQESATSQRSGEKEFSIMNKRKMDVSKIFVYFLPNLMESY